MADHPVGHAIYNQHYTAEQSSLTSSETTPPNHLGTNVPSHHLDGANDPEKQDGHNFAAAKVPKAVEDDEDEDEDIDALIDDLESEDGQAEAEDEVETGVGDTPPISEDFLGTSTRIGLTDAEVQQRRKKFGMNQMKEEKENLILKFLGYFVGPIQFVMEVSNSVGGHIARCGRDQLSFMHAQKLFVVSIECLGLVSR